MGHAGDSGIVLGEQDENNKDVWNYRALTKFVPHFVLILIFVVNLNTLPNTAFLTA